MCVWRKHTLYSLSVIIQWGHIFDTIGCGEESILNNQLHKQLYIYYYQRKRKYLPTKNKAQFLKYFVWTTYVRDHFVIYRTTFFEFRTGCYFENSFAVRHELMNEFWVATYKTNFKN